MTIIPAKTGVNMRKLITDVLAGYGLYYLASTIHKNFKQKPTQQ